MQDGLGRGDRVEVELHTGNVGWGTVTKVTENGLHLKTTTGRRHVCWHTVRNIESR
ncbi:MAG: hypothetical protein ACKVWR_08055 [Acidimicrobiales bacterium]